MEHMLLADLINADDIALIDDRAKTVNDAFNKNDRLDKVMGLGIKGSKIMVMPTQFRPGAHNTIKVCRLSLEEVESFKNLGGFSAQTGQA